MSNIHDIDKLDLKTTSAFAEEFLKGRLSSLFYDIERCLDDYIVSHYKPPYDLVKYHHGDPAKVYFPALMYCFSVVNLLGTLYAGNARDSNTTRSIDYIRRYMREMDSSGNIIKYDEAQIDLLYNKIYRHEITHLAMPQTVFKQNSELITWRLHDFNPNNHLQSLHEPNDLHLRNRFKLPYTKVFVISIKSLKDEIIDSVLKNGKYLDDLRNDNNNTCWKFKESIKIIYDVI